MVHTLVRALASPAGALAVSAGLLCWALMRTAAWSAFTRVQSAAAAVNATSIAIAVYAGAGAISALLIA